MTAERLAEPVRRPRAWLGVHALEVSETSSQPPPYSSSLPVRRERLRPTPDPKRQRPQRLPPQKTASSRASTAPAGRSRETVIDQELVATLINGRRENNPLDTLTDREREVLHLMAQGLTDRGIGELLWLPSNSRNPHLPHPPKTQPPQTTQPQPTRPRRAHLPPRLAKVVPFVCSSDENCGDLALERRRRRRSLCSEDPVDQSVSAHHRVPSPFAIRSPTPRKWNGPLRTTVDSRGLEAVVSENQRTPRAERLLEAPRTVERRGEDLSLRSRFARITVFETAAFDRSATPPGRQGYRPASPADNETEKARARELSSRRASSPCREGRPEQAAWRRTVVATQAQSWRSETEETRGAPQPLLRAPRRLLPHRTSWVVTPVARDRTAIHGGGPVTVACFAECGLNPPTPTTETGFRDRRVRPLCHPPGRPIGPRCRSGEGGIRTLEAGISPPNALAGRRLQPLGHFSGAGES